MCPDGPERKLAAILSADVVGYSRLMAEDEAATIRTLAAYREEVGLLVRQHRGRVVDFTGDNFLAEFPSALEAVRCAVEIQSVLRARNAQLPADRRMEFRIGAHLGDVRAEHDSIFGDGVNIAARLEGLAEPGGICISGTVHEQVERKLALGFEDLGAKEVKNIPKPVRVYRVRDTIAPLSEPKPRARPRVLFVAGAVGLLLVVGLFLWRQPTTTPSITPTDDRFTVPGFGDRPAIAVLAFDNLSGDLDQEYFADGIAEALITRLSTYGGLPVIARNSSFTYKGQAVDIQQVGHELGARYVVEGSVQRAGDRVRITVQLIDAATGHHVWAETYDRELRDIFAVQDDITESIVASMGPELSRSEQARAVRRDPQSLDSYELLMRGRWHMNRGSKADNEEGRRLLERAVALDPGLTWAYPLIASTHSGDIVNRWTDSPVRSVSEIERVARACVAVDARAAACQVALGLAHQFAGRQEEMIAAFERAVALDPGRLTEGGLAANHAFALASSGREEEAISILERTMRLNPHSQSMDFMLTFMGWAHFAAERYEEAITWLSRSVREGTSANLVPITKRILASSYAHLGRLDDAQDALQEALQAHPDLTVSKIRLELGHVDPIMLERYFDGLRKAGLPEE